MLDRCIAELEIVGASDRDLAPAEIARQLRLHKSTLHRLLAVLERHRLIRKGSEGTYGPGTRLIGLGDRAVTRLNLSERSQPFLRELVDQTGESAHVTILSDTEMLSVAHGEGRWKLQSLTRTGQRTQIHCTASGKAVLAFLPKEECDEVIARLSFRRHTRRTILKPAALKMELARVRARVSRLMMKNSRKAGAASARRSSITGAWWLRSASPRRRSPEERPPVRGGAQVMATARSLFAGLGYENANDSKTPEAGRASLATIFSRRVP